MPAARPRLTVASRLQEEIRVDVTRAILIALADAHPEGLSTDTLATLVSCEHAALQRPLRLLSDTGAVRARHAESGRAEVSITPEAIAMLRHGPRSGPGALSR